jgi:hypothetical protein
MTDKDAEDARAAESSQSKRYDKRIEGWLRGLQDEAEQRAPEVLDELASTAKNVASYLEGQAEKARKKQEPKAAAEEPQEGPADDPAAIERPTPNE